MTPIVRHHPAGQGNDKPQLSLTSVNPAILSAALLEIVRGVLDARGASDTSIELADVALERPRNRDHGDWASNIAMKLAKPLGASPRELATELATHIAELDGVKAVDVRRSRVHQHHPRAAAAGALAKTIVDQAELYGNGDLYAGVTINLEFVSANPTGPLHIGHTRWAALGDSLARVLRASGATLVSEFYINDAGNQMDNFGASILAAAHGEPTPENGYPGAYITTSRPACSRSSHPSSTFRRMRRSPRRASSATYFSLPISGRRLSVSTCTSRLV